MEEETEAKEYKKRTPAKNKRIKDLSSDDSRVAIVGTVIDVDEKNFVFTLDDASKKVNIILLDEHLIHKAKTGRVLRAIGLVIAGESGIELKGELVQDFTGLNAEYYNKYLEASSQ